MMIKMLIKSHIDRITHHLRDPKYNNIGVLCKTDLEKESEISEQIPCLLFFIISHRYQISDICNNKNILTTMRPFTMITLSYISNSCMAITSNMLEQNATKIGLAVYSLLRNERIHVPND